MNKRAFVITGLDSAFIQSRLVSPLRLFQAVLGRLFAGFSSKKHFFGDGDLLHGR